MLYFTGEVSVKHYGEAGKHVMKVRNNEER